MSFKRGSTVHVHGVVVLVCLSVCLGVMVVGYVSLVTLQFLHVMFCVLPHCVAEVAVGREGLYHQHPNWVLGKYTICGHRW